MKSLSAALWAEFLKVFRSKIFLATIVIAFFIPLIMGLLMLIIKHPELASKARMLAIKASMLGKDNWSTYLENLLMVISAGGLIIFGFTSSWIFGREYTDRTVKDLLALPVPRSQIVFSKFAVVLVWNLLIAVTVLIAGIIVGRIIVLDGWSWNLVLRSSAIYMGCAFLTILLCTPVEFLASLSRGFLLPLGFMIFTLMVIQISNFAGYTQYIPWAVPMLLSGTAGNGTVNLPLVSYIILAVTCIAGYIGTDLWWSLADQM